MKWERELYLELHNGTYTSIPDKKKDIIGTSKLY
jgi:alpha-mannosidase